MFKYILKNKDKAILEFDVQSVKIQSVVANATEFSQRIINIRILDSELLPRNLFNKHSEKDLEAWIENRKVPQNRAFVENIIATYSINGKEQLMDYIDVSLGLSLNDSYWIIPADKDYQWRDYNLYNNDFSQALERASFGEEFQKIEGFTSSPEYTTNGMLQKCWHREEEQIYLYKASSKEYSNGGKEAYAEYYMAQIAEAMQFDCIPYDLKLFHNQIVSACPIFTSEDEGFAPMYCFLNEGLYKTKGLELIEEIIKIYPKEACVDLLLFDALICNFDRHLGNFGMIVDNNTGEILRPAPIFDNGCSIMNILTLNELDNISSIKIKKTSFFSYGFDLQMKLFAEPRHIPNLEKLTTFTFKRHEQYNLSNEWLEPLEEFIQQRAKKALEFAKEKEDYTLETSPAMKMIEEWAKANPELAAQADRELAEEMKGYRTLHKRNSQ